MSKKFATGTLGKGGAGNGLGENLVSYWGLDAFVSGLSAHIKDEAGQIHIYDQTIGGHTVQTSGQPSNLDGYISFAGSNFEYFTQLGGTWIHLYQWDPLNDSYTINMWVRSSTPSSTSTNPRILTYWSGSTADPYPFNLLCLTATNDNIRFGTYNGTSVAPHDLPGTTVWDGSWHMITCGVDAGTMWYQIDAGTRQNKTITEYSTYTVPTYDNYNLASAGPPLTLGGSSGTTEVDADITQLAIWGESLSTDKVTALYNSGNGLHFDNWTAKSTCAPLGASPSFTISRDAQDDCIYEYTLNGTCGTPEHYWRVAYSSSDSFTNKGTGTTLTDPGEGYYAVWLDGYCTELCYPTEYILTNSVNTCLWRGSTLTAQDANCNITFSATTPNCTGVAFQWQVNSGGWVNLNGETSSTLTVTSAGDYRCLITCDGDDTTGTFTTISDTETCTDCAVCSATWSASGTACTLSLSLDLGTCSTPTYQWQRDTGTGFADIGGATSSTYVLTDPVDSNYDYQCVITCADTSVCTSTSVNVNKDVTISEPTSCNFTSSLSNTGDVAWSSPSYQWQIDTGSGFGDISGATSSTYTGTQTGDYRLVVTDTGSCSATSNTITASCTSCNSYNASDANNASGQACGDTTYIQTLYVSQAGASPAVNDTVWTDSGCNTTSFGGGNKWYRFSETATAYRINNGVITTISVC